MPGRNFKFADLEKYSGKGKYARLSGEDAIVIKSTIGKRRNSIKIFPEPLAVLCNSSMEEIGYGEVPDGFQELRLAESGPTFPNLFDHAAHYKAVARFIKDRMEEQNR